VILHIAIGFGLAFVGFITPAMLNMTTVRTSIEQGRGAGIAFGLGAATVNTVHSIIAFYFLRYLDDNPDVILWLKKIGVLVLLVLAYVFYIKSKRALDGKATKGAFPPYVQGILMSFLNMLGLPFYTAMALILESSGWITATPPFVYYMSFGVFLGGSTMFAIYSLAAESISKRSAFITKNINLILSGLFVVLASIVVINLLF